MAEFEDIDDDLVKVAKTKSVAEGGDVAAQLLLADMYFVGNHFVSKDLAEAVKWYRMAAEQGNAYGQHSLAFCHDKGCGVTRDVHEAVKWYRLAAEQGDANAQVSLGHCYHDGKGVDKDLDEAVKWYCRSAEQGNADAQFNLGLFYHDGADVEKDLTEAAKWYRKAAEQGNAKAQSNLGACYNNGWGVDKDLNEAVKWYRKAAEQGNAAARYNLGRCYADGSGVGQDLVEAVRWYRRAAEQGKACAQLRLGWCYQNGSGVPVVDIDEAIKWYHKAAEQGVEKLKSPIEGPEDMSWYSMGAAEAVDAEDQRFLGVDENGLSMLLDAAVNLFRQAAEQDNAKAQLALGTCFQTGTGVAQDLSEAIKWYRKAAENNNSKAFDRLKSLAQKDNNSDAFNALLVLANLLERAAWQTTVGDCYRNGWGIAKDLNEAIKWYRRAAELGDSDGMYILGQCHASGCAAAKDQAEAVKWYRKAADLGNVSAASTLGLCYEFGRGVEEDGSAASKWYAQAAKKGKLYALAHGFENGVKQVANFKKAFELYRRAFEENEQASDAAFKAGSFYENGKGVDQNLKEAVSWYRKSAELGNALAQNNLARCYQNGIGVEKDLSEAFNWCRMSADQGDATGQHILGRCYEEGLGVATDLTEAVRWYRISAEQGSFDALINLARCHRDGVGVERDLATAIDTLRFANSKNRSLALLKLGSWYLNGDGVAKDPEEAVKWYRRSAEQGNQRAKVALGGCYERAHAVSLDYKEAKRLYEEAAGAGDSLGKCRLGALYEHGRGVEKNEIVAAEWHCKAAQAGEHYSKGFVLQHGIAVNQNLQEAVRCYQIALQEDDMNYDAHYRLAFSYDHGLGIPQDFELAREAYEKAAAVGHAAAHRQLAILHENGQGVPSRNPEEARRLYCRAADLGDEESKLRLAGLAADAKEMASSRVTLISRYSLDHTRSISSIAPSPDNLHLACASHLFPSISFIDVSTGKALWKLPHAAHQVVFSPDGNHLAAACLDHTVKIIDSVTGRVKRQLIGHTDVVHGVAWSCKDPTLIASASWDKTARVWRVDGTLLHTLSDHESGVNGICFSPNGTEICSVSGDKSMCTWITESGVLISTTSRGRQGDSPTSEWLKRNNCAKQRVAISSDGSQVAMTSCIGAVWVKAGIGVGDVMKVLHHQKVSGNVDLAWSPNGGFIASADGVSLRIFDLQNKNEFVAIPCLATSVSFSLDGAEIIVGSNDGSISRWKCNLDTAVVPLNAAASIPFGKLSTLPTEQTNEVEEALDRIGVIIQRLEHPTAFQEQVQQLHRLNDPALRIKMPQIDLCRNVELQHGYMRKVKSRLEKTIKFTHELSKNQDNIQVSIFSDAKAAQEESIATVQSLSKVLDQEISLISSNLAEYSIISMQSAGSTDRNQSPATFPRRMTAYELRKIIDSSDVNAERLLKAERQLLQTAEPFTKALIDYDNCCAQFREESEKNVEALSSFIEFLANPRIEDSKIKEMEEIIESVRNELEDFNRISGALTDLRGELAKEASIGRESAAHASEFRDLYSITDSKGRVEIKMQIDQTLAAFDPYSRENLLTRTTEFPDEGEGELDGKEEIDSASKSNARPAGKTASKSIKSVAFRVGETTRRRQPAAKNASPAAKASSSSFSFAPSSSSPSSSSASASSSTLVAPFQFSFGSLTNAAQSQATSAQQPSTPPFRFGASSSESTSPFQFGASATASQAQASQFKFGASANESKP